MSTAMTWEKLKGLADQYHYQMKLGPKGQIRIHPTGKINSSFEKLLSANADIIKMGLGAPSIVKQRLADQGAWSRIQHGAQVANNYVNKARDSILRPMVDNPVTKFLGNLPTAGRNDPILDTPHPGLGSTMLDAMLPDSITGKAISASMLSQPETLLGRLAVPTATGAITGKLTGEGGKKGTEQGLLAAGTGEVPRTVSGIAGIKGALKLGDKTAFEYDDVKPGEDISKLIRSKSFDELFKRTRNWVLALRDGRPATEVGERFATNMENLWSAIHKYAAAKAQGIKQAFLESPEGQNYSDENFGQAMKSRQGAKDALKDGAKVIKIMKDQHGLRKKGFMADSMKPAPGDAAEVARNKYFQNKTFITKKLTEMSPTLADAYKGANQDYATFMALRDIADISGALGDRRHVDLDAINHELDNNPRAYQGRIGGNEAIDDNDWDSIRSVFRRHAPEITPENASGYDEPGIMSKIRASGYGMRGHVIAPIGEMLSGRSLTPRPVGNVPGLLESGPRSNIPRLVLGTLGPEALKKGEEQVIVPEEEKNATP